MATEVLNLGGRYFAPAESTTFEQDAYLMGVITAGRLQDAAEGSDPNKLVSAIMSSGQVCPLLAGLLIEVDAEWTRERAAEWAAYFAQLRDPAAKGQLQNAVPWLLLGFFGPGASSSSTTSSDSASAGTTAPDEPNADPSARPVRKRRRRPGSTANGPSSS